ncbi:MAG: AsmA family protein [Breznakibacter sp.]|nr:AsmA family protein [Breznakibacter sp.]
MKKTLTILGAILGSLILLIILVPLLFKGPIERKVKQEINNMVNATIDYQSFSLSLIRSFPDLRIGLEGLTVVGADRFANDTLLAVNNFSVEVDLMSALSDNIQIKAINIDQPKLHAIVLADSTANWDIMKETGEETPTDTTSAASAFKIQLNSFVLNNGLITYSDSVLQTEARIAGLNVDLTGDMSADQTNLQLTAAISELDVIFEKVKYLNKTKIALDAMVEADLKNSQYTFKENLLDLNGIPMAFDGWVKMKEASYDMDLKLAAKETSFKTLLALVPEVYMKDYQNVKANGTLALEATAKGEFIDTDHLPAFNLILAVNDGSVKYPNLPKSVDRIQIDLKINNPGGSADATVVDLNKFHFELGGNPFDANFNVVTPVSNATFKGAINGTIDLGSLKDAIPLEDASMNGMVKANINMAADYNMIEKEEYENINASGQMELKNFSYTSKDLPQGVNISNADMALSPRYITLNAFSMKMGKSDFDLNGRLENYLAYALKDGILKGTLNHRSNLIDSNEFLTSDAPAETASDSAALEIIEVPKNINFELNSTIGTLLYDKLTVKNAKGKILVKDGRVMLDGLKMEACEGVMVMNGEYNTQNMEKPFVAFDINVSGMDINAAVNSFSVVDSLLPIAKHAFGKVNTKMSFNSLLGKDFMPVLSSVGSTGNLKSDNVEVKGAKFQDGLATALKNDKYKTLIAKNININFRVENGNIIIDPFKPSVFGKELTVSGQQSLDQSILYQVRMPVERQELSALAGLMGLKIPDKGDDLPVGISIKGTIKKPEIGLNLDEAKKILAKEVGKELEKEAEKAVDKLLKDPAVKKEVDDLKKKLGNFLKEKE